MPFVSPRIYKNAVSLIHFTEEEEVEVEAKKCRHTLEGKVNVSCEKGARRRE